MKMNPIDKAFLVSQIEKDTIGKIEREPSELPPLKWVKWAWEELSNPLIKKEESETSFRMDSIFGYTCIKLGYPKSQVVRFLGCMPNSTYARKHVKNSTFGEAYKIIESLIKNSRT